MEHRGVLGNADLTWPNPKWEGQVRICYTIKFFVCLLPNRRTMVLRLLARAGKCRHRRYRTLSYPVITAESSLIITSRIHAAYSGAVQYICWCVALEARGRRTKWEHGQCDVIGARCKWRCKFGKGDTLTSARGLEKHVLLPLKKIKRRRLSGLRHGE